MHILCPHCHNPIELVKLTPREEILCPSCGSSFQLEGDGATTKPELLGQKISRFELLATVGVGAFGTVYKARDAELDRTVALKVPRAGNLTEPRERERFLREARSAAQLRHPSIVTVYQVGQWTPEGAMSELPFIVSDFVEGVTLADVISRRRLAFRESAELVAQLAEALQYAHDRGVVHRDVKPSNIMLEAGGLAPGRMAPGESRSDDRATRPPGNQATRHLTPRLMDFGMAKRDAGEITMTVDGQMLGTPAYMSPEQAKGEAHSVDGRSDVYSLGVILYELLTGELPFRGNTRMLLYQLLNDDPRPPRSLNDRIPRDLETICLKAMAKEASRRFQTAGELTDDVRRWLKGEPIMARPVGQAERAWRWCRRSPLVAGLSAAVSLVLLAGATVSIVLAVWATRGWEKADENARKEALARKERALAQVDALLLANPQSVPNILAGLEPTRADVLPRLRELWAEQEHAKSRTSRGRVALALLAVDPPLVKDWLSGRLLDADDPRELMLLRDGLRPYKVELREILWRRADAEATPPEERFRALVVLAAFDPDNDRWKERAEAALEQLLTSDPLELGAWAEALRPVRRPLLEPLASVFRGRKWGEHKRVAATLLADYAADQPELLADLAADADARQYALLLARLKLQARAVRLRLLAEWANTAPEQATNAERDHHAFRQANAAVTLAHLGETEPTWQLLQHRPDPSARTHLIDHLRPYGIAPDILRQRLLSETDASVRRALLLSLGDYPKEELPATQRQELIARLIQDFQHDTDPGIHGAIEWLLRQWKEDGKLPKLRSQGPKDSSSTRPTWYVNGQGQTLTVIPGPVEFVMGAPSCDPDRAPIEMQHRRKIERSFAIATKEVTVGEFRRFLQANPEMEKRFFEAAGQTAALLRKHSPEDDGPMILVDWYKAAAYCNWLSEQEKLPPEQWCYPRDLTKIGPGMVMEEGYLRRTGYRLPTEAEWEYACRAGAVTSRYHGRSEAVLERYAWYQRNAAERAHAVGRLRPNDLGLFDMLGNVAEWCQDRAGEYPQRSGGEAVDDSEDKDRADANNRIVRGGVFDFPPSHQRSSARWLLQPATRFTYLGLRVARTH